MLDEFGFECGHPEHTTPKKDRIIAALKLHPNKSYTQIACEVFAYPHQVSAIARAMGFTPRRGRGINIPGTKFKDLADYGKKATRLKGVTDAAS